jgi:DNA-binding IclR family transcriptional regulator
MSRVGAPPIESVDRALQLVSMLRDERTVTVSRAAERLGVAASTAHRLLAALVYRGYATQDRDRSYRAGPELADRADPTAGLGALRVHLRPALELLHDRTGETAELMALQGENVCFVDGIESIAPLRVTARIGDLMPAHCAAGGKALLAELSDGDLDELFADGLPPWPTAQVTDLGKLKRQLRTVRRDGYATNLEETEQGVCGIGVPIHDASERVVGSFVVAVPSARFVRADLPRYVEVLRAAANVAAEALPGGAGS